MSKRKRTEKVTVEDADNNNEPKGPQKSRKQKDVDDFLGNLTNAIIETKKTQAIANSSIKSKTTVETNKTPQIPQPSPQFEQLRQKFQVKRKLEAFCQILYLYKIQKENEEKNL